MRGSLILVGCDCVPIQAYAVCRFRALPLTPDLVLCRPSGVTPASLVACPWRIPARPPPKRRQG